MREGSLVLFEPPASNRATGGYRFNDALTRALPKMRRLHLTPRGVARIGKRLLRPERETGHRSHGADLTAVGALTDAPGSPTFLVDSLYLRHPAAMGALRRLRRAGARCILLAHLLPSQERPGRYSRAVGRRRDRAALRTFDGAVAPSRFMQSALATRGVPEARIAVVAPPDGGADASGAERPARAPGAAPGPGAAPAPTPAEGATTKPRRRLVSVANLHPVKNLHAVIPALPRSDADAAAWIWEILGSRIAAPGYFHRIRRIAAMYGVAHRIRFRGVKTPEEVASAIANATALLVPSRFESFGMVARTAAQLGTPIIASNIGGIPEAIATGATSEGGGATQPTGAAGQPDRYARASPILLSPTDTAGWSRAIGAALSRSHAPEPTGRAVTDRDAAATRFDFEAVYGLLRMIEEAAP